MTPQQSAKILAEFGVESTPCGDGVLWRLPSRDLPYLRPIAAGIALFSIVVGGVMLSMLLPGLGKVGIFFAAPIILIIFAVVIAMVFVACSRAEIRISGRRLVSIDRVGFLSLRRSGEIDKITKFVVERGETMLNGQRVTKGPWADSGALIARSEHERKELTIALAYPMGMLEALASVLSDRIAVQTSEDAPKVTALDPTGDDYRPEKPLTSGASASHDGDADLTITLPADGVLRSRNARPFLVFGVLWLSFIVFIILFVFVLGGGNSGSSPANIPPNSHPWTPTTILLMGAFGLVFTSIGVVLVLAGLSWSLRRATIDVIAGGLVVTEQGLFRSRVWRWDAGSIDRIYVGPSGINRGSGGTGGRGTPVLNLRIKGTSSVGRSGRNNEIGLFAPRDDDELRWVASELRTALRLDEVESRPRPA